MHVDMAALVHLTTEKAMPLEPLIQAIEAGVRSQSAAPVDNGEKQVRR